MPYREIRILTGSSSDWAARAAFVPKRGEFVYNSDTGDLGIGDGSTALASLRTYAFAADVEALTSSLTTAASLLSAHRVTEGTPAHAGLGNVVNATQFRIDLADYAEEGTPAADDFIPGRRTSDGAPVKIRWSTFPGASPTITEADAVAGTGTTSGIVSPASIKAAVLAHAPGGSSTVSSINGRTPVSGAVVLTPDDFSDGSINRVFSAAASSKLAGIEEKATAQAPLSRVTGVYVEPTTPLFAAQGSADYVRLPEWDAACIINDRSAPTIVVAPEGITAEGANFAALGAAGTWIDFDIVTHSIPNSAHQKGVISCWFRGDPAYAGERVMISSYADTAPNRAKFEVLLIGVADDKYIRVYANAADNTKILDQRTAADVFDYTQPNHLLIAFDLSVPVFQLAINGTLLTMSSSGYTPYLVAGASFPLQTSNLRIGGRSNASNVNFHGSLAQLWMMFDTYLDLTSTPNIAKFFASAAAVSLGMDGRRPTGARPHLFLDGAGAEFRFNQALMPPVSGTVTGTLADASPVVPGQVARHTFTTAITGPRYVSVPAAGSGETGIRQLVRYAGEHVYRVI